MNSTSPPNGAPAGKRPSLDQILWMGIQSSPGELLVRLLFYLQTLADRAGMVGTWFSCRCARLVQDPVRYGKILRSLWFQEYQDGGSYRFWYFSRLVSPNDINSATRADSQCSCGLDMRSGQSYRRDTSHGADL
jgi:hypothetical protein